MHGEQREYVDHNHYSSHYDHDDVANKWRHIYDYDVIYHHYDDLTYHYYNHFSYNHHDVAYKWWHIYDYDVTYDHYDVTYDSWHIHDNDVPYDWWCNDYHAPSNIRGKWNRVPFNKCGATGRSVGVYPFAQYRSSGGEH